MKVLFYNHTASVSGAERVLLIIVSQLSKREFEPVVLCPSGDLQAEVEAIGVPSLTVEPLEARFTWRPNLLFHYLASFVRAILSVRQKVKSIAPDLIHANSIRAGLTMTAATIGRRVPVVWHLHDLLPHHPLSTMIRAFALSSSRLRLLAVSQATAQRFRGLLLRAFAKRIPTTTILNCVDTNKFRPNQELGNATRAALRLPDTTFAIGIVGQITERKGQLGLLRAFAKVAKKLPQTVLLVVGEPLFTTADQQYHQRLRQTADELGIAGQVRFLGARRDIPALMQALDLLVVNSLEEPCGLVVLEGMASGLPVIATAVGGNPEILHHGSSGWLVPARRDAALAQAILHLAQLPGLRWQLSLNARIKTMRHFAIEIYMNKLREFYLSVLNARDYESRRLVMTKQPPQRQLNGL